ncbi:MAG: hypothetical protein KC547_02985 [Anaerolineae bacterium]|nr:hypothetical protein [Anaerolineae bacterium]
MSITSRLSLALLLLCSLLLLAGGALAHGDEEDGAEDAANVLTFYTHPTERFNVLIPPGWQNVVNSSYALLRNDAIGAQIYGLTAATTAVDEAVAEALTLAELPQAAESSAGDAGQLAFGPWQQRTYTFDNDTTATVFVQQRDSKSYVLLYVSASAVQPLIMRTETPLADEASARAALTSALTALGRSDAVIDSVSADSEANNSFSATLTIDDTPFSASIHRDSLTTADIVIGPGASVAEANEDIFTIVRDFFVTPDNGSYLILGLVVAFGLMGLFLLTLWLRQRNLERDEAALRTLMQNGA